MTDVGNMTSYVISGLSSGIYYVTVTVYDLTDASVADDPGTIVNEKQTSGYESWYADEITMHVQ